MWLLTRLRLWKRLAAPAARPTRRRNLPTTRLRLEPLEDRTLLSTGWAISSVGTDTIIPGTIALSAPDSSGDMYVTGYFSGTETFGNTPPLTASSLSTFVAKVGPTGDVLWAVKMGGSALGQPMGIAVDQNSQAVDLNSGDVYVTGSFGGTATFGSHILTSVGTNDIYVCQLNPNDGTVNWVQQAGETANCYDEGEKIAVDPSGNIFVAGVFGLSGAGVIAPVSATFGSTTLTGTTDVHNDGPLFLSKMDANGNFLWSKQLLGGQYDGQVHGLATDSSGNAYVSGSEWNSQLNSQNFAGFIEKVDPSGKTSGKAGWTQNMSNAAYADAVLNQDPVTGNTSVYVASVSNIQKLDASNGNVLWSEAVGAPADARGFAMAVDSSNGNLYVTGQFQGSGDFDPGPGTAGMTPQSSSPAVNAFLVKLDSSGNFLSARNMSSPGDVRGTGVALDSNGNIYTAGGYSPSAVFDTGTQTVSLTGGGLFLCKTTQDTGLIFGQVLNGVNNTGMPGVTVYLDLSHSGSYVSGDPTAVSDAQGYFHFTDLTPGAYTVGQIVPSGDTVNSTSFDASVVAGQAYDTNNVFVDSPPTQTRTYSNTNAVKTSRGRPNAISSISVPDSYTVLGITLSLDVTNTKHNNLTIYLTGPDGTKVALGSTTQSGTLTFPVPNFDDTSVTGTWTLEVDGLSGGKLNSWSMVINGTQS